MVDYRTKKNLGPFIERAIKIIRIDVTYNFLKLKVARQNFDIFPKKSIFRDFF
jgi:hypothetical protein